MGSQLTEKIPINHFLLIMRATFILLFTCIFCAMAEVGYTQNARVTINKRNTTLKEVLNEIEKQTDYLFIYNNEVNTNERVSVRGKQEAVSEILNSLLKDKDIDYTMEGNHIILSIGKSEDNGKEIVTTIVQQQKKQITGKITDEQGESIIGANIVEVGTTNGTVTDIDGNFTLQVENDATIQVSYIGYLEQIISVSDQSNFNLILIEDTQALEEVVVVGYGVQRRASVTGSVASIQASDITSAKTASVTNALAGKLPGLRAVQRSGAPGDDAASIDIRGYGNALIIVDGIERDFNQIDANDIESISILKDASAAVYGFKGANGVILVTTKKGQQGKAKIDYTGYYGFQKITRYPTLMNGYEYALLYNEAQQNLGVNAPFSDEDLTKFKNGIGTTDWFNETVRSTMPQMYHNVSVSGGSEKVKYFFSLGLTDQEGMYKSNDYNFQRYNVRSNINAEITKSLTVDLQLSGRLDSRQKPYEAEPLTRSIQMARPIYSIYANDNPDYWQVPGDKGNPIHLSEIDNVGYSNRDRRVFNGAISFNWKIPWLQGLSAKAMLAYDFNNTNNKNWYKEYYEYLYDASTDTYNVAGSHTISELTAKNENYFKPTQQYSLNYNNEFGSHDISALLLWELYNDRTEWVEAYRQFSISAIDQINAGDKVNINNGGNASVSAHQGFVGRFNYAYASKYLAELSFRYDGSYKFAPEKRWGFFPAISLGWRISEESFFKEKFENVENLKLRGSYGKIGDEGDFAAYQYLSGYTYPNGNYVLGSGGLSNGAKDKGMPNLNLTWYESTTLNIGFEASAYQGLLSLEFDYFQRKREGLLATRLLTLPTTFGRSLPQENLNSDNTKGFEIVVGHRNKISDFTYDIKGNFSATRSSYGHVERAESANMYDNWRNNTNDRFKSISWGKKVLGQFQSYEDILNSPIQDGNGNKSLMPGDLKYQDWNNDGIIDGKDDQPIGHGDNPWMYYGLNLFGSYKNIDVTLFFQGAAGHEVFTSGDFMDPFIQQGLGNGLNLWMDRWHREDPSDPYSNWIPGFMPALRPAGFQANTSNNTWTMQKASYLRLKTLEVGYSFSDNWIKVVGLEKLRLYVNSFNLLTFTNNTGIMKYMDPENSNGHFRYYPQMKTFNFGINLTF
ncbi:SusC/RagA family TonB-linked outer membrane protein [Proteiniphilum saccharofermentans]|uniref:SusC/RagA family TonB-linked outer membrane protein n=1 Tax=Proteiniphilum saccharofermentans TaxID=1642647 RepID=UPI00391B85AA